MQKDTLGLNQLLGKVQKPCQLEGKGQRGGKGQVLVFSALLNVTLSLLGKAL